MATLVSVGGIVARRKDVVALSTEGISDKLQKMEVQDRFHT